MYTLQLSGFILRRVNRGYAQNGNRLASLSGQSMNSAKFNSYRKRIGVWIKEQGDHVAEACTRQFEFIIAQRIRRSIQIFHLYTRIWDEVALKEFLRIWRRRLQRNTKHFMVSAMGIGYNWQNERISDEELNSCKEEIKGIHKLMDSTVVCENCHLRMVVDICQPGIKYCKCNGTSRTVCSSQKTDGWQPFIERQDMLIWRREEPDSGGLFAYKVYGNFSDVTAEDFLQAQIDVDYRREWDSTAQELQILETDPATNESGDESSDVIYWEMIWPRLFSNRDYVYQRRWIVDRDQGIIVIISKVTEHPNAPTRPGIFRVTSYWSYMVIRPYTDFHSPGIEFGLTYFDDPGISIPSAVRAWVAMTGVPDFLMRMRAASKGYKHYKLAKQGTLGRSTGCVDLQDENKEAQKDVVLHTNRAQKIERVEDEEQKSHPSGTEKDSAVAHDKARTHTKIETARETDNPTTDEDKGFLNYFFFTKLFP